MATLQDMTLDDLKKFVEAIVDRRLSRLLGTFELPEAADTNSDLSWDDVRAAAERHRWTPPPGAKSSLEFLREDRTI